MENCERTSMMIMIVWRFRGEMIIIPPLLFPIEGTYVIILRGDFLWLNLPEGFLEANKEAMNRLLP